MRGAAALTTAGRVAAVRAIVVPLGALSAAIGRRDRSFSLKLHQHRRLPRCLLEMFRVWQNAFKRTHSLPAAAWVQGDDWASYMEVFQLTAQELQGLIALQCLFDAKMVRLLFAVVTPLVPLALLLACCFVEFFSLSTGFLASGRPDRLTIGGFLCLWPFSVVLPRFCDGENGWACGGHLVLPRH